jgi:perosamine synthetase
VEAKLGSQMGDESVKVEWWSVDTSALDLEYISEVVASGFPNEGPVAIEVEKYFQTLLGVKHAILTTSGTTAIFLALKSIGIGPGDRVGVPNLTFIATANAVALTGAEPVLLEILPDTLSLDPSYLLKVHTENPLDALVPVHVSGRSALSPELCLVLESHGLRFIEDAAEALASKDPATGRYLGTLGNAGAFSFSPNKIVTSGQGGLVVTNDDEIALKIRELKDQGRPTRGTGGDDVHHSLGFNFKFTDLQAALLKSQLKKLDSRIFHLRSIYEYYLANVDSDIEMLKFDSMKGELPLWPEIRIKNRSKMEQHLKDNGIGFRNIWHPLSTQEPYKYQNLVLPQSETAAREILWLPSAFSLTPEKLEKVVKTLNSFKEIK